MMKITAINCHLHSGEFSDLVFVEVKTDDPELSGWGECTLPGKPYAVAGAIRDATRLVLGSDPTCIRSVWEVGYRHGYWRGGAVETSALSGIDIALWDIAGKRAGVPVHQLLGGAVRNRVRTYANLGLSTDPEELARRARRAIESGFEIVKFYPLPPLVALPSNRLVDEVYDCCAAVREAIGSGRDFAVDFHGRPLAHTAIALERSLRSLRPLWVEEPVPVEDNCALRRVRSKFETPIALGERLFTRWQFREILDQNLADIIQPDVGNVGGISEMRVLADMAEASSTVFSPHSPNALLHTAASVNVSLIAQSFGALEYRSSVDATSGLFSGVESFLNGQRGFGLPQSPGLGISVNEERCLFDPAKVPILAETGPDRTPLDW